MIEKLTKEQQEKLRSLAELLQEANRRTNLTRITDLEDIQAKHFEDSLVILEKLREIEKKLEKTPKLIDIGSGAGFPGLVLAIALPGWHITSVEATGKKVDFQKEAVRSLGLSNVQVVKARAEELGHNADFREKFDVATSRAVGNLAMIAELCIPFLKKDGHFLAWKGPKVEQELKIANKIAAKLGSAEFSQSQYELAGVEGDFRIVETVKQKNTSIQYPREFKVIKKESQGS